MVPVFVQDGILNFYNEKGFMELIGFMDDAECELIVRQKVPKRTLAQNRYYFGVVVKEISAVASELHGKRFDEDKVHMDLCEMFNYKMELGLDMQYKKLVMSTTKLTIPEFARYIDDCITWAEEFFNFTVSAPEKGMEYK